MYHCLVIEKDHLYILKLLKMFSKSRFIKSSAATRYWTSRFINTTHLSTRNFSSSELRTKKLIFRAKNTGMKELDIILSDFIKDNPDVLESHHKEFESLLDMETCHIYDIVMGKTRHDLPFYKRISAFAINKIKPND